MFCIAICTLLPAQALVTGKIYNQSVTKLIELSINTRYLDGKTTKHESLISDDGYFRFEIDLKQPGLLSLHYNNKTDLIYLEENDTLHVEFISLEFPNGLIFSGKAGVNNVYLKKYFKENKIENNLFKLKRYKYAEFWNAVNPTIDEWMRSMDINSFTSTMKDWKDKAFSSLEFFKEQYSQSFSPVFIKFLESDIYFNWAYHMMVYGTIYKNKHEVPDEFLSFIDGIDLEKGVIHSYNFRRYAQYLTYHHLQKDFGEEPFIKMYEIIKSDFYGELQSFLLSETIARAFHKKKINELLPQYDEFLSTNLYTDYDEKVISSYQKFYKFAVGAIAPPFAGKLLDGAYFDINAFKGDVIFLNFWASWCKPCLRKMETIRKVQSQMEKMGVIFVHISLDNSLDKLTNALNTHQLSGKHLWLPEGVQSEIAENYGVKALPQFFIIDKFGRLTENPTLADETGLIESLTEAVK